MNAPHYVPGMGLRFFTVVTRGGIRLCAWARTAEDACAKVHGALSAWEGLEPLAPGAPANDNGAKQRARR